MSIVSRGVLEQLQAYWDRKRGSRDMPARSDFDPADIPRLLPYLVVTEVEYDAQGRLADFKYRLWGEHVIDQNRRSLAGRRLSDLLRDNPRQRAFLELFQRVAIGREPGFRTHTYKTVGGTIKTMDISVFPLAGTDGRVETLVLGAVFRDTPEPFDPSAPL